MRRLVAVSNRVGSARGAPLAGGLAVALVDALRSHQGLWFGWSGKVNEAAPAEPVQERDDGFAVATVDLRAQDYDDYYNGFANRCLWPLFHFRIDLATYDRTQFEAYQRVNARFAEALLPLLRHDDLVWVHDYHLFCFAAELRKRGARQRMGFFLHIPFPPRELMVTLPHHLDLVRCLFQYDLVGFQTQDDVERFCGYVVADAGATRDGPVLTLGDQRLRVGAFPVGIDADQFRSFAFSSRGDREYQRMREVLRGQDQIIGVDRLDYSKGLLRRLNAYEMFLEQHTDLHGRVGFLQIAPVSRGEVKAYADFRRELEQRAANINGRFGRVDWTPVRYLNQAIARRTLAGFYRASRVGLVTPMRDGMNLVAKEYVAAQDPDDPGVLVLSRFAGSAHQMDAALLVNPYDAADVADALGQALRMQLAERQERHASLLLGVLTEDVSHWRQRFIATLARSA